MDVIDLSATAAAYSLPDKFGTTVQAASPYTILDLRHSHCGDAAIASLPVFRQLDSAPSAAEAENGQLATVQLIDLSHCDLTVSVWPLLEKCIQQCSNLTVLRLSGNFREEMCYTRCCAQPNTEDVQKEFVSKICAAWEPHPRLAVLSLDAFLVENHVEFQRIRKQKLSMQRDVLTKRSIADEMRKSCCDPSDIDAVGGSLFRAETVMPYVESELPDAVVNAASAATSRHRHTSQPTTDENTIALVEVQLEERKDREKIVRMENASRLSCTAKRASVCEPNKKSSSEKVVTVVAPPPLRKPQRSAAATSALGGCDGILDGVGGRAARDD